jgi:hypothetical protein
MSVEKLSDKSRSFREPVGFAQIINSVIEHIKDNDAFRIYSYLCSKDQNWTVIKEWTAKQCGIGEKKARQCWSYLARCKLIEYIETRDEQGKIRKHDIKVLAGYDFKKDEPFININQCGESTQAKTASVDKNHRGKKLLSGESTRVDFAPLLNKDIKNKNKQTKDKIKNFSASDDAGVIDFTLFDNFWSIYPKKQDKQDSMRIWKTKKLEEIGDLIIEDVKIRIENDWKGREKQFVPSPAKYLGKKKWNDEIIAPLIDKKSYVSKAMNFNKQSIKTPNFNDPDKKLIPF